MRSKRIQAILVGALLATVMLFTVSSGAASAAPYDPPTPTVTYQWHDLTLWYSKSDVRFVNDHPILDLATNLLPLACTKLPHTGAQVSCGASVVAMAFYIGLTFDDAEDAGQCVWMTFEYLGDPPRWGRYNC